MKYKGDTGHFSYYKDADIYYGKVPDKPFSGKISLRITPELHKEVAGAAMSYLYPYLILTSSFLFSNNKYSYWRYIMEKKIYTSITAVLIDPMMISPNW